MAHGGGIDVSQTGSRTSPVAVSDWFGRVGLNGHLDVELHLALPYHRERL